MDTNSNSSNEKVTNCCTCGDLLTPQNRKSYRNKNCNTCIEKHNKQIEELKTEKPNTNKCKKCKFYRPIEDYLRPLLKTCKRCRQQASDKRKQKKGEITEEGVEEENEDNIVIYVGKLFLYLKNVKHPNVIDYSLQDVIQEIIQLEEGEEEQSQEEEDEEQEEV